VQQTESHEHVGCQRFFPAVCHHQPVADLAGARRTHSAADFYTAGGQLPAWQNGLALAGDYLSAAAFLGAIGMYLGQGYDSLVYAVGTLAGWPLLMLLLADKLRTWAATAWPMYWPAALMTGGYA
jgi:Na+(H+)/acetate symporter ActP